MDFESKSKKKVINKIITGESLQRELETFLMESSGFVLSELVRITKLPV